jgi:hypothetical protein
VGKEDLFPTADIRSIVGSGLGIGNAKKPVESAIEFERQRKLDIPRDLLMRHSRHELENRLLMVVRLYCRFESARLQTIPDLPASQLSKMDSKYLPA